MSLGGGRGASRQHACGRRAGGRARAAVALACGVAIALGLAATGGCAPAPSATSPRPIPATPATVTAPSAGPQTTAPPSAVATPPPAELGRLKLRLQPKWGGLDNPVALANAGDGSGRLFVLEQAGTVREIVGGQLLARPYLDIRDLVSSGGERGLLGIAFSPAYATNGAFYLDYTNNSGNTVIARFVAGDPSATSPKVTGPVAILTIRQPYANHKGGCVQFGPDGFLYIGMGDGGREGDPLGNGQNSRQLLGKLLRIDVEKAVPFGRTYAIPPGQRLRPGWAPQIWATGLRNPWRFSFDTVGGSLWIADVGQDAWEEVDAVPIGVGGQNFGWSRWEGDHPYPVGSHSPRDGFTFPVSEYSHSLGRCITGGYVYRGGAYPALTGTYVYGDYIDGWVAGLRVTDASGVPLPKAQARVLLRNVGNPSSFGVDESGELYMVDYGGTIAQVTATAR